MAIQRLIFFILMVPAYCIGMYEQLAHENLPTLPAEKRESHDFFTMSEFATWAYERQQHLEPRAKREMVFNVLGSAERALPDDSSRSAARVLDDMTRQDLNLIAGTRSSQRAYLAAHLDRTHTELGRCILMHLLVNPLVDTMQLRQRQDIVRNLVRNDELFQSLDGALAHVGVLEDLLLAFWSSDDQLKSMTVQKYVRFPWLPDLSSQLNKQWWALELTERLSEVGTGVWGGIQATGMFLLPSIVLMRVAGYQDKANALKEWALKNARVSTVVNLFTVWGTAAWLAQKILPGRVTSMLNDAGAAAFYGIGLSWTFDMLKADVTIFAALQQRLIAVARVLDIMREIDRLAQVYPEFAVHMPACDVIHKTLVDFPQNNSDLKKLFDLLAAWTFSGDTSIFSRFGVILAASKLMYENKEQLNPALAALGEIDAYVSIARLYKEGQGRDNTWCFADYREKGDTCPMPLFYSADQCNRYDGPAPQLELDDFWNPMLEQSSAVSNSIALGIDEYPRVMVVTGPSAGGKSTITRGAVLSALLAQTIGIVPARRCELTPCMRMVAYLNIVDDVAAGNSHFKAGVKRAREVMNQVERSIDSGGYVLVALDEVFDGTSFADGQASAYSLLEHIAKQPYVLCFAITHYPILTQLERHNPALYKNYKVSIASEADGRLAYLYTLEPGVADQHSALDILRDEGFDEAFLERMRELI